MRWRPARKMLAQKSAGPRATCAAPSAHGAGIIFKGSGFYETDYRSESYKAGAKKESESKKPKTDSKSKTDSKAKPAKSGNKSSSKK